MMQNSINNGALLLRYPCLRRQGLEIPDTAIQLAYGICNDIERVKMQYIYYLVKFFSPFC